MNVTQNLLRVIADCGNGDWKMPSCVDGLAGSVTPNLYFHDLRQSDIAPWIERFKAEFQDQYRITVHVSDDTLVTTWYGRYLGHPVTIKLFQDV